MVTAQVLREESQRALACELGGGFVVRATLVAVEAVVRFVDVHGHTGLRLLEGLYGVERNPVVLLAEVRHHRHGWVARRLGAGRHAATVVRRGGGQALERAGRAPGQQTTPAIAHDADLASLRGVVDGGLHVGHHAWGWQGFHSGFQFLASLHVGLGVAEFNTGFDAVERGGCDREVAISSVTIGHGADVGVHAEDFLQHHHGATRLAGGLRHVGGKFETIGRCEFDRLTHGGSPVG